MPNYGSTKKNRTTARQQRNERPPDANTVRPEVSMSDLKRKLTEDGRAPRSNGKS